jgi:hypothetical protein
MGQHFGAPAPHSDAGRYQFLRSTWQATLRQHPELAALGFGRQAQDMGAWLHAQDVYRRATGGDLLSDLRAGKTEEIRQALAGEWLSLKDRPQNYRAAYPAALAMYKGGGRSAIPAPSIPPSSQGMTPDGHTVPPVDYSHPLPTPAPFMRMLGPRTPDIIPGMQAGRMRERLGSFLDPGAVPPLGVGGGASEGDRNLTVSPSVSINVSGVSDPGEAARMIGSHQDRVTADLVRTGLGAVA